MEFLNNEALIRRRAFGGLLAMGWAIAVHGGGLFGSYTVEPAEYERRMPIGLESWREPRDQALVSLLLNPFPRAASRQGPGPGRRGLLEQHGATDA